ncbi:hypothetical protein [Budvicia aquatica]|uniref:Uncharacterized protein n=1 Tax=Budvicia aquatica TaxID=82979 RepID=A0A484ZL57_9GAMM|nr:hypothetical protein [Budvicia aquatica]VFS49220.1 Uncharacterised protein [Budvicia aquatica]
MERLAVSLPYHSATDRLVALWLAVLGFGPSVEILANYEKGEYLSMSGNMQVNQ